MFNNNYFTAKKNPPTKGSFDIGEILDNPYIFGKNVLTNSESNSNMSTSRSTATKDNENVRKCSFGGVDKKDASKNLSKKIDTIYKERNPIEKPTNSKSMENYAQKSSIRRFNESAYNIMDVIKKKRLHRNNTSKPDKTSSAASSSVPFSFKDQHSKVFKSTSTPQSNQNPQPSTSKSGETSVASSSIPFSFKDQQRYSEVFKSTNKPESDQNNQANLSSNKINPNSNVSNRDEIMSEARQDFLQSILQWNITWLKDQDKDNSNNLCEEKLERLKLEYESVSEYIRFYKPLVLNEIFSQIREKIEQIRKSAYSFVKLFLLSYEAADNFLILNCVLPIKNEELVKSIYPNEGDLMIVEMSLKDNADNVRTELNLGYLSEFAIDDITEKTTLSYNIKCTSCNKLLRFIIKMKVKNVQIDIDKHIRCCPIFYLKPVLRQCDSLVNLDKSALANGIVKPFKSLMKIQIDNSIKDDSNYNASQLNVMKNAAILVNSRNPGILLVQGPPGAGKTHTLIGMVKKIFLEWKNPNSSPKLLICAPSNGAIDEIGKRLFKEREFFKKSNANRDLRIIRIGQEGKMNEFVRKNLFIDTLIERNIKFIQDDKKDFHAGELEEREGELRMLELEENRLEREKLFDELKRVKTKINILKKQVNYLQKSQINHMIDLKKTIANTESHKKKLRNDLLAHADIVLTTLSSCCSSSLLQIFNSSRIFNCCIIDEASQCSEPEILMPLSFSSINKMILIGDPMQLQATTISPVASKYNFGRSLFERFYTYVQSKPTSNQYFIMLNIQYRMHSAICRLPSQLFYKGQLQTYRKNDSRKFPLVPYTVFDVQDTKECTNNVKNIHNTRESDFVLKLAGRCVNLINGDRRLDDKIVKIGVITPYQGQRKLLENKLLDLLGPNNKIKIEVNTIDGYQGREMDVIIISAVRSNNNQNNVGFLNSSQRLNVAITRAKCSLFICLNAESLNRNQLWRQLIEDAKQREVYYSCPYDIESSHLENYIMDL